MSAEKARGEEKPMAEPATSAERPRGGNGHTGHTPPEGVPIVELPLPEPERRTHERRTHICDSCPVGWSIQPPPAPASPWRTIATSAAAALLSALIVGTASLAVVRSLTRLETAVSDLAGRTRATELQIAAATGRVDQLSDSFLDLKQEFKETHPRARK